MGREALLQLLSPVRWREVGNDDVFLILLRNQSGVEIDLLLEILALQHLHRQKNGFNTVFSNSIQKWSEYPVHQLHMIKTFYSPFAIYTLEEKDDIELYLHNFISYRIKYQKIGQIFLGQTSDGLLGYLNGWWMRRKD